MVAVQIFVAFVLLGAVALADVEITLSSHNDSIHLRNYKDYMPFRKQYANTKSEIWNGTLHQATPSHNACSLVEPVTREKDPYHRWFALVEDYPSCVEEMAANVRDANYSLIFASSRGNSHRTVSEDIAKKLHGFPIVIVSEEYADYLKQNALTDPDSFSKNSSVIVYVNTNNDTSEILMFFIIVVTGTAFFVTFCILVRWRCVVRRRRQSQNRTPENEIEGVDQNMSRGRLSRAQHIDRFLQRQLLHINARFRRPLGEQQTKQLPLQRYTASKEDRHSCAICVDEFVHGCLVRTLPCGHKFHSQCVDIWFIKYSSLCPLCKRDVSAAHTEEREMSEELDQDSSPHINLIPQSRGNSEPVDMNQYGSIQ